MRTDGPKPNANALVSEIILDASALLALINEEPGSDIVAAVVAKAAISAVNLAEVASKLTTAGMSDLDIEDVLEGYALDVVAFDDELAYASGRLYRLTQSAGLSLGDRACLALALWYRLPVLTTDRAWSKVRIGVEVRQIRR